MQHCQAWSDVPQTTAPNGVAKRSITGDQVSLVTVRIPAGIKAARHSHDFEQFVQVISGSGSLETEAGTVQFDAGWVFHFRPGTWHAAVFDTETLLVETNLAG